jgi:hypothetical protein
MYSVGTKDEEKQNLAKLEALEKLVSERPSSYKCDINGVETK